MVDVATGAAVDQCSQALTSRAVHGQRRAIAVGQWSIGGHAGWGWVCVCVV
jgi:hypothetical protein